MNAFFLVLVEENAKFRKVFRLHLKSTKFNWMMKFDLQLWPVVRKYISKKIPALFFELNFFQSLVGH